MVDSLDFVNDSAIPRQTRILSVLMARMDHKDNHQQVTQVPTSDRGQAILKQVLTLVLGSVSGSRFLVPPTPRARAQD